MRHFENLTEALRENEIIIHILTLHTSVKSRSAKRAECASVLTPERLFSPRKRQEFLRFSSFLLSTNSFSLHPRGQTSTPSCLSSFMDMIGFLESTCTFLLTIDHVRDVSLPGLCRKRGLRDQHRSFRSYSHSWNNCQKLWMRTFSYQSTSIGSFTSEVQHLRLFILNPDHEKKLSTMLRKNGHIAISGISTTTTTVDCFILAYLWLYHRSKTSSRSHSAIPSPSSFRSSFPSARWLW